MDIKSIWISILYCDQAIISRTRPTELENHAETYRDVANDQIGTIEVYPDHEKYLDSAIEAQISLGPDCSIILRLAEIVRSL